VGPGQDQQGPTRHPPQAEGVIDAEGKVSSKKGSSTGKRARWNLVVRAPS
jgi:hypothetical protein